MKNKLQLHAWVKKQLTIVLCLYYVGSNMPLQIKFFWEIRYRCFFFKSFLLIVYVKQIDLRLFLVLLMRNVRIVYHLSIYT